ncbi:MAG TPA: VWA domain-containing protein [Ktedonobacterales bacterium]|nr:VWA domain-containing protein [Ktedonobacterales bacterium]
MDEQSSANQPTDAAESTDAHATHASTTRRSHYLGFTDAYTGGGHLLHNILLFGRLCKGLGMDVSPNRMIEVARALEWVDLGRKQDVYHTMRALIVTRQRDLATFDEAFNQFWRAPADAWTTLDLKSLGETRRQKKTQYLPPLESTPDDDERPDREKPPIDNKIILLAPTYSQDELLRTKDFADMTGEEIAQARDLMVRLRWSLGVRESRRYTPGKGRLVDPRRAFRANLRYEGDPFVFPTHVHKIKPRPLVLICDISGSMERYTRLLLHFMHTLAQSVGQVESFVFGTRLSRITRAIRHKSIEIALREAGTAVKDWGGGTRMGEALHTFNYRWSRRALSHGAVVVMITDGWDRGDPDLLRAETQRLQRNCYRLIWLNPLLGAPQYEPLTRGAQALLPYVDDFLPIRNLANLETLARELTRVDWRRPERAAHAGLIVG